MKYPDSTAVPPTQPDSGRVDARPWAGEPEQIEAFRPYLLGVANKEIAPRLRPKGGASDIVQDTLLEAYRDLGQFSGHTQAELKGWLRRILRNNLANFVRRYTGSAKRRVGREVSIDGQPDDRLTSATPSPSGQAIRREQAEILEQAMARLTERDRLILVWRNVDNCEWQEIGRRINGSAEKARKICARALDRLAREIGEGRDGARP